VVVAGTDAAAVVLPQGLVLLAGVVAVVGSVAAYQVIVVRLDGGLVVLPVGVRAGEVDVQVPGPLHHAMVDELRAVIEVHAQNGQWQAAHGSVQDGDDESWQRRLRIERMKVHPVSTSLMFTVRANSSLRVGPQWVTVTDLEEPQAWPRPRHRPCGS